MTNIDFPCERPAMNVLVLDVGGTNVKILGSGNSGAPQSEVPAEPRKLPSGPTMTPEPMVSGVKDLARDWSYDAVSIGYPGVVTRGRIVAEPYNLAPGWIDFDFEKAFGCPVKILNDAAMQALGSYQGGLMLFLGLGTGLGSALIADGVIVPMELAHMAYRKATYEDYLGVRGLKRLGKKKWKRHIEFVVAQLTAALHPDDVVLGGGNVKKLKKLPSGCRAGNNANAFLGGFRLWDKEQTPREFRGDAQNNILWSPNLKMKRSRKSQK
jgi:predicted NBD/HSP70 family sugar kinase